MAVIARTALPGSTRAPHDASLRVDTEEARRSPTQRLGLSSEDVEEVEGAGQGPGPLIRAVTRARDVIWRQAREARTPLSQVIPQNLRKACFQLNR